MCGLLAPLGTAIPNLVGGIVQLRVAAVFEFAIAGCLIASYTQKLWMRVKRKAAYLPG
jgi:hypothetical protein